MNQDNFICDGKYAEIEAQALAFSDSGKVDLSEPALFGVFDGMGGEECGEVASYIAVKVASEFDFGKDGITELREYCERANGQICEYADDNGVSSMGTTAAILLFSKKGITLCNIGDSKIFRHSGGKMQQISKDHVAISAFGVKPPLTQNLGIPPEEMHIEPYIACGECVDKDKYLICSDGLTDMVKAEEIENLLNTEKSENIAEILLEKALENGGKDNITIIALEIQKEKPRILNFVNKNGGKEI